MVSLAALKTHHIKSGGVAGAGEDGNNPDAVLFFQSLPDYAQFTFPNIVGVQEVGTNHQQHNVSLLELCFDFLVPDFAGYDFPVVPCFNAPAAFEHRKMRVQFVAILLVFVRVGK